MFKIFKPYLKSFSTEKRKFFLFYIPNFRKIKNKQIVWKEFPKIEQITICEGRGKVSIGFNCTFGYKLGGFHRKGSVELQARYPNSRIFIGSNVSTNNNIFICAANYIEIGNDTLIGQNVSFMDHEAHGIQSDNRRKIGQIGKIVLGKNVWVGNNVNILKNSEIGDNSIIAAGAVVSGVFPNNVIIGGVPAKIIKRLDE